MWSVPGRQLCLGQEHHRWIILKKSRGGKILSGSGFFEADEPCLFGAFDGNIGEDGVAVACPRQWPGTSMGFRYPLPTRTQGLLTRANACGRIAADLAEETPSPAMAS